MSLIELFTDYILNRKNLKEYVELRKTINERGEFNDAKLLQAEENLQRLKKEEPEVYEGMYETLTKIYERNAGLSIEYPLDFIRQILKMYKNSQTPAQVYEEYKRVLEHYHHDV
ncbi:MAG: alpha/beta hydrolase [Sulfuricurvum sp.]|uniref:alpha/beta hydrolase n=1 Tax=Sulfuricurvum sp. TaxID=2025608 RepID=UPI002629C399|nr:alpha/beta hydrolase [Sulfuricurvum sp.]MDD2369912.1 alpha/beta hydrolase [Sulfuricurvum sp.]MDD2949469.1 alpha/beta hydrolase [Sulfuricurvum sp.]MDD5118731.1 alpha/beta hydrolase [Sulfuricurvum sp.]